MDFLMKKYLPYLLVILIMFYIMPFAMAEIPIISESTNIVRMLTFILTVFLLIIVAMSYSRKNGFTMVLPLLSLLLFIPYGFLANFPPFRIFFYMIFYFFASIIGLSLGLLFKSKTKKKSTSR